MSKKCDCDASYSIITFQWRLNTQIINIKYKCRTYELMPQSKLESWRCEILKK